MDATLSVTWHEPRLTFRKECMETHPDLIGLGLALDQPNVMDLWRPPLEIKDAASVEEVPSLKSARQFW